MKSNISKHPCANKCTEFKEEQCKTCLVQDSGVKQWYDVPSHQILEQSEKYDFLIGDVVVLTATGTKDVLLEIIQHKYTNDLYRVRILKTGACGPIHKDQIRNATIAELHAKRRLTKAEQALSEVS